MEGCSHLCSSAGTQTLTTTSISPGPDFLCIGLQKAGTDWLYDQLDFHPDFWMPPFKELHFFDSRLDVKRVDNLLRRMQSDIVGLNNTRHERMRRSLGERELHFLCTAKGLKGAPQDLDRYAELFESKGSLLSGDITPGYSYLPEAMIERISERFPAMKVVLLLRDPIDRSWSQINMHVRQGKLTEAEASDWGNVNANLSRDGFSARSHPSKIWSRWTKFIPPERIRYFFFDDLQQRPAELRANILRFLGADPEKSSGALPADYNRKTNRHKIGMSQSVREHMIGFFCEELLDCARIFDGPAKKWLSSYGLANETRREA
jgi:hypothetical protein